MQKPVCVITGATSGIGKAAAFELAGHNVHLVLVARNAAKADAVKRDLEKLYNNASVAIFIADFASQKQIRACAQAIAANYSHIDMLVNNAGMVNFAYKETEDKIEEVFAVNHLAPFLFTSLLLPLLKAAPKARIIIVASEAHKRGGIDFNNLGHKNGYTIMKAYRQSKLANVLFTKELARRLENTNITVNCMHPGFVRTGIGSNVNKWVQKIFFTIAGPFITSEEAAGKQLAQLCIKPELEHVTGKYFYNGKERHSSDLANDNDVAKRLWVLSEKLTGLTVA